MWRAEDAALVQRLEDEVVLERLWRFHVGIAPAPLPHPRASGMIALVRGLPGGSEAVRAALGNDLRPLRARLEPASFQGMPPALVHHIALYYGDVGDALAMGTPEAAALVRVRALGAWLALAEEGAYLRALARDVLGAAADASEVARAAEELPLGMIEQLGASARDGARELTNAARAAARTLAQADRACRMAAASAPLAMRAQRLADRHRTAALEHALASFSEALEAASAANELVTRAPAILGRLTLVWQWSDQDEAVEHFAVEQAAPACWEMYRGSHWNELRALLGPLRPIVESLAARIERDPSRLAYAAPVATMYVFYVDIEPTLDGQIALAERAVRVCPAHRNGRFTLANLLCERAMRILDAGPFVSRADRDRARACLERAEKLNPDCRELDRVRARLG
jgi:hypothetical protein